MESMGKSAPTRKKVCTNKQRWREASNERGSDLGSSSSSPFHFSPFYFSLTQDKWVEIVNKAVCHKDATGWITMNQHKTMKQIGSVYFFFGNDVNGNGDSNRKRWQWHRRRRRQWRRRWHRRPPSTEKKLTFVLNYKVKKSKILTTTLSSIGLFIGCNCSKFVMQQTHFPRNSNRHSARRAHTDQSINSVYLLSHNSVVRDHLSPFEIITKENGNVHHTEKRCTHT